ncbi:endonuclease [Clostridia bacterium]|nr:endonuclease [Clostridia bacterium]
MSYTNEKKFIERVGISSAVFYPEYTELACERILKLPYKIVELFLNTDSETRPAYLQSFKDRADEKGIRFTAVHPYLSGYEGTLFFSDYKRRTYDSINLYRKFFAAANFLGAKYLIIHGLIQDRRNYPAEEYAEVFAMIAKTAAEYGVTPLQENIAAGYASDPDFIKALIKADSGIKFALDIKHTVLAGRDIYEVIDAMGQNLAHIHFSDMMLTEKPPTRADCRLPFDGNLNLSAILDKLDSINYIGDFVIEVYKNNYKDEISLAECYTKLDNM